MLKKISLFFLLSVCFFSCSKDENVSTDGLTYYNKPVGSSASDLLSSNTYSSLEVEVVYVEGYEPTATTLNNLKAFLLNRLHKPQGINITKKSIVSPGLAPYSISKIRQVESQYRSQFNSGATLSVFVFIADGSYADNQNVLGVAYRNTSVALFGSKIDEYSGSIGQPSQSLLETTVMNHEFGHIMGLVNVGTALQTAHQDQEHGHHCNSENCLMYWTAETGDIVTNLVGASRAPELDSQCIADLRANGGK